jgi:hypothetical protein
MELSLNSPFLDFFRRGDAPIDVRLAAAQGRSAPRPLEQLAILAILTNDSDQDVRQTAEATLSKIPVDGLAGFLARSEVPEELRTFFKARGIVIATTPAPERTEPFVDEDDDEEFAEAAEPEDEASMLQKLANMTVPQKVKAAMKGTREMRAVLIRDPNKLVSLSVLSSPKVTETEVEAFARMGSVAEDVLRTIARTRAWMKNYGVVLALAKNAKTPVAISLNLLPRLNDGDVKRVSTDRNVPEPLRLAARKRMVIGG